MISANDSYLLRKHRKMGVGFAYYHLIKDEVSCKTFSEDMCVKGCVWDWVRR